MGKVIRCNSSFIQARERVNRVAFTLLPRARESLLLDTVTSTTPKDKAMFEESSELCSMIQEETAPSSKSISETPTSTKNRLNTSWLPKVPTQVNTFFAAEKQLCLLETSYLWTRSQRVLLSATLSHPLEIKESTRDAQEPMPPLLGTLTMDWKLESDCHLEPEKLFLETAELLLVLLLVEVETKSLSWKQECCSTNSRDRERDSPE